MCFFWSSGCSWPIKYLLLLVFWLLVFFLTQDLVTLLDRSSSSGGDERSVCEGVVAVGAGNPALILSLITDFSPFHDPPDCVFLHLMEERGDVKLASDAYQIWQSPIPNVFYVTDASDRQSRVIWTNKSSYHCPDLLETVDRCTVRHFSTHPSKPFCQSFT